MGFLSLCSRNRRGKERKEKEEKQMDYTEVLRWLIHNWYRAHLAMNNWRENPQNRKVAAELGSSTFIFLGAFNFILGITISVSARELNLVVNSGVTVILLGILLSALAAVLVGLFMEDLNLLRPQYQYLLQQIVWCAVNFATVFSLVLTVVMLI